MENANHWKLLLIGIDKRKYCLRRVFEEATRLGIQAKFDTYGDYEVIIDNKVSLRLRGEPLSFTPDAVILDAPGPYAAIRNLIVRYLMEQGSFLLNGRSLAKWSWMNKLTQIYELQCSGITIIPTQCFGSPSRLLETIQAENVRTVIKSIVGAEGRQVYEVNSQSDLMRVLSLYSPPELLVQPMLQGVQELRILVLGDNSLGAVRKTPAIGQFRANWAQGASFESTTVPDFVDEIAIRSCQVLQCDFAGVDILFDGGESYWILEVNRYADFEGFEHATQINVPFALLNWIDGQIVSGVKTAEVR